MTEIVSTGRLQRGRRELGVTGFDEHSRITFPAHPLARPVAHAQTARSPTLPPTRPRDGNNSNYVDLDSGSVVPVDDAGWDLACRRHFLTLRGGKVLPKWYRYRIASHQLEARGDVYEVPTEGRGSVNVRPVSYYCADGAAGCVTLRFWVD